MNHIMVDLETMSNAPNAAIVAVGAVAFSVDDGIGDQFYFPVGLKSSMDAGLHVDPDTIEWWMNQSQEARRIFARRVVRPTLERVLGKFSDFVNSYSDVCIWGNGADFDNAILASAYRATGLKQPWPYWMNRCYRTVSGMSRDIKMKRAGTHHNALDDAKSQAEHLIRILNKEKEQ